MTIDDRYRVTPRLGLAALVCLGAATAVPLAHADAQDPKGNNGTVKVAPYGDIDSIPNNTPHVGCTFQLEWYGFDAGVTSTVLFEEQPPTTDVGMSVSGDTTVVLDDDPGAGAGNDGFDGSQAYTLSFTGDPHPQQGYHVRLTINTPESKGADVKHKVFWVEGCTPPTTPPPTTPSTPTTTPAVPTTPAATPTPAVTPTPQVTPQVTPQTPQVQPQDEEESEAPDVLGEQASNNNAPSAPAASQQALPTSVNAGLDRAGAPADGSPVGSDTVRVLLGALLVLLGGVCARLGWLRARG